MPIVGNVTIVRGGQSALAEVMCALAERGIETIGNPDLWIREITHMGVEDARELRERAFVRAVSGVRRIFVVVATSITVEAQNTLLKTLEEPPADAWFFLIVPSPEALLPTVRSRAHIISAEKRDASSLVPVAAFLSATPERRIEMLKPLLDKGDDDKRDLSAIVAFLREVEAALAARLSDGLNTEGARAVLRARRYMGDKGALLKPLLEQVALLVPMV